MGGNSTKPEAKQTSGNTQSGARASVSFGDFAAGARNASQGSKQTSKARSKKKRKNAAPTSRFQHDPPRRHCASSDSTLGAKVASQPKHRYTIPKSYSTRLHGASVHGTQRADLPVYERVLNGGSIKDNESDEEDTDDEGTISCSDVDEDVFAATESTYRADGHGQGNDDDDDDSDDDGVEKSFMEERMDGDDADEMEFDLHGFAPNRRETSRNRRNQKTYPHIYDYKIDGQLSKFTVVGEKIDLPSNSRYQNKPTYEEVVIPPPEITTAIKKPDLIPVAELDKASQKAFRGMETLNLVQTIVFDAAYNTDENLLVCAPTGAGKTNVAMLAVLHEVKKHIQQGVVKTDEFKIVYVAPMKALAAEMVKTFGSRLRPLGISVKELTGDSRLTKREIMQSQMLVVTPEKWDVITRKCTGDATIIQLVKLLIIDEVHLLHEDRGAVIECLVARTLRQVEAYQNNVRIVGLSATLPNYRDVAEFLHVDLDKGLFFFDSRFRPVPLQQSFIGVKNLHSKKTKEKDLMNDVCYEKMIELVKNGHQVLIFVFSRAGTRETADELLKRLKREPTEPFSTETHESFEDAKKELEGLPDQILMDLVPKGLAVHHGGISRQSRDFVEKYFSAGLIRVLCCTTTLAWGVNLPAHAVIIKGTKFYNPDTSTQEDLGILDVLQIFGRAGRPQFDTFGEGYIITSRSKLRHYLLLLMTQDPIESKFKMRLADNLNAEIVLGTVSNMEEALRWLRYTYLYIRMRRNPEAYKLSFDDVEDERRFEDILKNLVTTSARFLQKAKMIKTERGMESFEYTEIGRIASHFYVTCGTIQHFNQKIPECRSEEEIFAMICGANEFMQVKVRQAEEGELKDLLNLCELYVSNARHMFGETKVNILLQAYISHGRLKTFSLVSDMNYIAQSAARLMRALFELALDAGRPHLADQVLKYTKAVDQRIWPMENRLYQLHSWECNRVIASDRSLTAGKLEKMDPCTIGSIVYGSKKKISKDEKRSCGLRVQGIARQLPFVSLDVSLQPLDHSTLRICLKVTPDFIWKDWKGGCGSERWWIWVENSREHRIHHYEYFSITKRQVQAKEPQDVFFNVCLPRVRDVVYTVRAISEDWLGVEAQVSVRLDDFVMPSTNEFCSEPTKLDMTALWNNEFQKLFDFRHFNAIQQSVFDQVYTNSDGNVLLGAPSYSGKIVVAELAMLALFKTEPWSKVVYIAPLRALAMRRFTNWKSRFGDKLGKKVRMLNGDVISDASTIRFAEVIVTTAANWEAVSRTWETVRDVSLIILDGLQFLGDECGPILEAIVARAKRMSKHTGRVVRLIGLSATMANAKDVARWLEVDDDHLFNFQSVHRPVKLELKVTDFSGKFCHIRTAAMNKPVYNAIKTTKKGVLVFVSSRKQATATAFELIAFLRHEENPQMWCRLKKDEVEDVAASVSNQNLQRAVSYGIGMHHPGLSWSDRRTVEKLYRDKHLKVIVATKSLAWSSDLRARLVIVKGTEQYDAGTQRYVDMPVTDLLQMIGRAGRYKKDSRGTALVMVQNTKRDFYHKALRAPVTTESRPDRTLPEYVNAEVVSGNIKTEQDFENLLKTTFFYTRLTANPSYYGLPGTSERALKKFLSDVMDSTLADLSNTQCIRRHKDEDHSVSALPLGRIASQNHVHHDTVKMVRDHLKPDSSIQDILTIISNAVEFAVMPVRYDEENINRTLSGKVRYPIDAPYADFTSPHTKVNLLLQAHIGRVTLPCTDYELDTRNVLEYTGRILKVLVEIADMWKWYQTEMNVMYLTQAVVQAQWSSENSLLTLPHVQPTLISSFVSQSGSGTLVDEIFGKEIESLKELISVCRGDKSALHAMLDGKLHQNQIKEIWNVLEKLPEVHVDMELRPRSCDGSLTNFPVILQESQDDEKEVQYRASVLPNQDYRLDVILTKEHQEGINTVYAPHYPKRRNVGWRVMLRDVTTNQLLASRKVGMTSGKKMGSLNFKTPAKTGIMVNSLHLVSDCYLGLDQDLSIFLNVQDSTGHQPNTDASCKTSNAKQSNVEPIPRCDNGKGRDDGENKAMGKENPDKPALAKGKRSRASKGKSSAQRRGSIKSSGCPTDPRLGKEEQPGNETKPRTHPGKGTSNRHGQHLKSGETRMESQGNRVKPKEDTFNGVAPESSHGGTDVQDGKTEATERTVERKRNGEEKGAHHRDQTPHSTEKFHTAKPAQPEFSGKGPAPKPDALQLDVQKRRLSGRKPRGCTKGIDLNLQDPTGDQPHTDASLKTKSPDQEKAGTIPRRDYNERRDDVQRETIGKETPDKLPGAKRKLPRASKGKSSAQRLGSSKSSDSPKDPCRLGKEEHYSNETKSGTQPGKGTSNHQGQHLKNGKPRRESQGNRGKPKADTFNGVAPKSSHGGTEVHDGKTEATEKKVERKRNGEKKAAPHRDQTPHSTEKPHTAKPAQPEFSGKGPGPRPDAGQPGVKKSRLSGRNRQGSSKSSDSPKDACRLGKEEHTQNETKPGTQPGKGTSNPHGQHLKNGEPRRESQGNRGKPKEDTLNGVAPESSHGGTDVHDGKTEATEKNVERKRNGKNKKAAPHRDQTPHSTEKLHTAKPAQPEFSGKGPGPRPDAGQPGVKKRRLSGRERQGSSKSSDSPKDACRLGKEEHTQNETKPGTQPGKGTSNPHGQHLKMENLGENLKETVVNQRQTH